jgi:hypothetical protein
MLTRIVFVCLIAAAMVGTTSGPLADEPDELYQVCVDKSDREALAAARESCDVAAEGAGYTHGVLRPHNPHDGIQLICSLESPTYLCVGVGGH